MPAFEDRFGADLGYYVVPAGDNIFQASMLERSATETTSSSSFREEETNYGLTVGGGLIYRLGKVNLRGSIDWVDMNSVDEGRITSATIGIEFNF